jgi:hypothetical protein
VQMSLGKGSKSTRVGLCRDGRVGALISVAATADPRLHTQQSMHAWLRYMLEHGDSAAERWLGDEDVDILFIPKTNASGGGRPEGPRAAARKREAVRRAQESSDRPIVPLPSVVTEETTPPLVPVNDGTELVPISTLPASTTSFVPRQTAEEVEGQIAELGPLDAMPANLFREESDEDEEGQIAELGPLGAMFANLSREESDEDEDLLDLLGD